MEKKQEKEEKEEKEEKKEKEEKENKENKEMKPENNENVEKAEEKKEEEVKNKEEENKINNNEILDSYRKMDSNITKESPSLTIEEIDCNLLNGQKIQINAQGMIGGRGLKDGVSIFGCNNEQNENPNHNNKQNLKSDFILNFKEKLSYPFIFMIYFERETKSYYIKSYISKDDQNKILYIKLDHEYHLPIKQKELIIAGNIVFQVSPISNNKLEIINLSKENESSEPKQTFDASSKKEITIGRNKDCDFPFPGNKSFSRIQTTFEYSEENKEWEIIDGSKIKSSTNGTWVFCTHSFPIKNNMIIEIMNYRLQITEQAKSE